MLKIGIIMKTLSITTNGGKRIKFLVATIIAVVFFHSCDIGYLIPFENNLKPNLDIATETGSASINCMCFQGKYYYLGYDLKGSYIINPDSLKLLLNDENLIFQHDRLKKISINKGYIVKSNSTVKDCYISIDIRYERKDETKDIKNPLILSILPSDFITSNGKRILNDTLRVKLFNPMKK